ncbi:MAG: hypothetical protein CUN55_08945 [Phototrophicales bacterium]|nr:MAG: hypothetical protein CUN55_08945 [Phototrophicales bacterium]
MLTILVALDDNMAQQELVEMLRTIYQQKVSILQPQYEGHLEELIAEHYIDIIFIPPDQQLLRRIRNETDEPMILALGPSGNDEYELELVREGVQEVLHAADLNHKRLLRVIEFSRQRHEKILEATSFMRLEREIAECSSLQELLELVTDVLLRRTGASGCLIAWAGIDGDTIKVMHRVGRLSFVPPEIPLSAIETQAGILGDLFGKKKAKIPTAIDVTNRQFMLALENKGERKGFISIEGMPILPPSVDMLRFLRYLSERLVVALEKVQAQERRQYHIRQMNNLYKISISITDIIDQEDAFELGAWGLANLLEVEGAFACDYDQERHQLIVRGRYATFSLDAYIPTHGTIIDLNRFTELGKALTTADVIDRHKLNSNSPLLEELNVVSPLAMLVFPLLQVEQLKGVVFVCHDNLNRRFLSDDIAVAQSLAIYLMTVLHQAALYRNIQQLQEAKSEMIQRVSHDLKSPIHLLVGYLSLLRESISLPTEEQEMYFEALERSIQTMNDLVADILVLEKVETLLEAPMQPLDIIAVLHELISYAQNEAQLKQQTIHVNIPIEECWVLGDQTQLGQALQNLIGNALKYTPEGGNIYIRANAIDGNFWFEVEDDGYGIPPEKQARLFERFYRAQTPGTEHIKGTGLGLYLVKTVAERHRGQVWYQSAPERGSIFGFRIPLAAQV